MSEAVRVSAVQFYTGTDVEENLQTCLRMLEQAGEILPDLIVLPEFCNHSSWYRDRDYSYEVAIEIDGFFTRAIAEKAKALNCYIMLNCTVRRENNTVTGTNILFDRLGDIVSISDKQVLMGNENNFLTKATDVCPILETPLGRIGMYSCMDGVIFETPRGIALRGAQILLNSLNSFADDEGSLHIPVRAAENKVFVVAANKVGSLVPEELAAVISERVKMSPEQLHGAGESQIVAPDGTVLAKAPESGEAVIYADIDVNMADNKARPDGTDIIATRRPELYQALAEKPLERQYQSGAREMAVAVFQPSTDGAESVQELLEKISTLNDITVLVLPELFHIPERIVQNPTTAQTESQQMVDKIIEALNKANSDLLIATSIVTADTDGYALTGVLISRKGIQLKQNQTHSNQHHANWQSKFGNEFNTIDTDFGRIAIVVGHDSIYPEVFRVLALQDVEVLLLPTHITESWEITTGLLERAAENRINIVVASRKTDAGSSIILGLDEDFTLWTEWKKRPFDGNINYPLVTKISENGFHKGTVYPACSGNRLVSQKTDVVDGRPYWLLDALVK